MSGNGIVTLAFWFATLLNDVTDIKVTENWLNNDNICFKCVIYIQPAEAVIDGWQLFIHSTKSLSSFTSTRVDINSSTSDGLFHVFENKPSDSKLGVDKITEVPFEACVDDGDEVPQFQIEFRRNVEICPQQFLHSTVPMHKKILQNVANFIETGRLEGQIQITPEITIENGWKIYLTFSRAVNLNTENATLIPSYGHTFTMENKIWNQRIIAGQIYNIDYTATLLKESDPLPCVHAILTWNDGPISPSPGITPTPTVSETPVPTTSIEPESCSSRFNYDEVLHKSILFYEAQRSGRLPDDNRISWRFDSALEDQGIEGEDLIGGWYDAGDYVKFGFPMAFSTTLLTWGLVEYPDSYLSANEHQNMLDCIKWPLDYSIKAHTKPEEFYGQVGQGDLDHAYWGRPEEMTMERPAFKIDASKPGSDLAAETAAAMAAASIVFRNHDQAYSELLVNHSKSLFDFADRYRGKYSDSITDANAYYPSTGYFDELTWAAAWIFKATNNETYLNKAEDYFVTNGIGNSAWGFSWDEKNAGVYLLLYDLTQKDIYKTAIENYFRNWLSPDTLSYTPKGLAWRSEWGANRYAANTAYLALLASKKGLGQDGNYEQFGRNQIHYMLGDAGRSFVVGFGNNPPQRPHHASSSCPDKPASCGWNEYNFDGPNPQLLFGALVGGPSLNDAYEDKRDNFINNEVACDYNAGFQSGVAALKALAVSSCTVPLSSTEHISSPPTITIMPTASLTVTTSTPQFSDQTSIIETTTSSTSSISVTSIISPSTVSSSASSTSSITPTLFPSLGPHECGNVSVPSNYHAVELDVALRENWDVGFTGRINLTAPAHIRDGWEVILLLGNSISLLQVYVTTVTPSSGTTFTLKNTLNNKELLEDSVTLIDFTATKQNAHDMVPCLRAVLRWKKEEECPGITPLDGFSFIDAILIITNRWNEGISGNIQVVVPNGVEDGWKIMMKVSVPITLTVPNTVISPETDGTLYILSNMEYNAVLPTGDVFILHFNGVKQEYGSTVLCASALFLW